VRPSHLIYFCQLERSLKLTAKRKVEVFSVGCPACADVETLVKSLTCPLCEVDG
jgi:hypothetical protein